MSSPGGVLLLLALLQAQAPAPAPASQGRPETLNLTGARLAASSVQLGEVFDLTITARVPGGHLLFFPDTLEVRNGVESAGPARHTLQPIAGDSMELTLVYPLRAFATGGLTLPQVDVFLQRQEEGALDPASEAAPTVRVGEWSELSRLAPGRFTRRPIVPGSIQVQSVLPLARPAGGFHPRDPADVVGRNWGIPVFVLLGLALAVLAVILAMAGIRAVRLARGVSTRLIRVPIERRPVLSPRDRAIAELEAIRQNGLHTSGRMDEFYTRSTRVARRYVEVLHPSLGPWLTDRELVARLTAIAGATDGVHPVRNVFGHAEVVRFGVHVPRPEDAEGDLETLRRWVAQYPPENGTS